MSQAQLAKKLALGSKTLFLYEQARVVPSIEAAARISRFFEISLDELVFDHPTRTATLRDRDLAEHLIEADHLPLRERTVLKELIELFLMRHQVQVMSVP